MPRELKRMHIICKHRISRLVPNLSKGSNGPCSFMALQAIRKAIDDYAECQMGHREYSGEGRIALDVDAGEGAWRGDIYPGRHGLHGLPLVEWQA
jgi:hypothetical protein